VTTSAEGGDEAGSGLNNEGCHPGVLCSALLPEYGLVNKPLNLRNQIMCLSVTVPQDATLHMSAVGGGATRSTRFTDSTA